MCQLVQSYLGTALKTDEPVCEPRDGGDADVQPDEKVAKSERPIDEWLRQRPRGLAHRIRIGRVEGEGSGGQPVGDEVDLLLVMTCHGHDTGNGASAGEEGPEQLHGHEGLGHACGSKRAGVGGRMGRVLHSHPRGSERGR